MKYTAALPSSDINPVRSWARAPYESDILAPLYEPTAMTVTYLRTAVNAVNDRGNMNSDNWFHADNLSGPTTVPYAMHHLIPGLSPFITANCERQAESSADNHCREPSRLDAHQHIASTLHRVFEDQRTDPYAELPVRATKTDANKHEHGLPQNPFQWDCRPPFLGPVPVGTGSNQFEYRHMQYPPINPYISPVLTGSSEQAKPLELVSNQPTSLDPLWSLYASESTAPSLSNSQLYPDSSAFVSHYLQKSLHTQSTHTANRAAHRITNRLSPNQQSCNMSIDCTSAEPASLASSQWTGLDVPLSLVTGLCDTSETEDRAGVSLSLAVENDQMKSSSSGKPFHVRMKI